MIVIIVYNYATLNLPWSIIEKRRGKSDKVANSSTQMMLIRPDKMSGLIWIQTVWHSDGNHEVIFPKNLILNRTVVYASTLSVSVLKTNEFFVHLH